jgi:uncharacterized alkaline shock family protein YloU
MSEEQSTMEEGIIVTDRSSDIERTGRGQVSALETEQGTTSISDSVVAKIAAIAAREVEGVSDLGGTVSGAIGSMVGRIRGDEHQTSGVGVEVGTRQAAVDLTMKAIYPTSIHQVAESVRQNVIDRIESMTGLEVVEVNIAVVDLAFPGGSQDQGGGSQDQGGGSRVA